MRIYLSMQTPMSVDAKIKLEPLVVDKLTIEIIDAPCKINYMRKGNTIIFELIARHELASGCSKLGNIKLNFGEEIAVESIKSAEELGDLFVWALSAYWNLAPILKRGEFVNSKRILNEEQGDGYIVNDWKLIPVTGAERPDLMCWTQFGEPKMCRHYPDEKSNSNNAFHLDDNDIKYKTFEDLLKAAESGCNGAMQKLICEYQGISDFGIEPNPDKVAYWTEKLARTGDWQYMYDIALIYMSGNGVKRDFRKAEIWLKKLMDEGNDKVIDILSELQEAIRDVNLSNNGDAEAQGRYAKFLMSNASEDNYADSFKYASMSAKQGNLLGIYILGLCYEHGRGTKVSVAKAKEAYLIGAEAGDAACQFNLGCCLISSPKTKSEAIKWIEKAALQDYVLALPALGQAYENGDGVECDFYKAIYWYEKAVAVDNNNAEIYYRLAITYMNEVDNKMISLEKAVKNFKVAAELGHQIAKQQYKMWHTVLEKGYDPTHMTREQMEECNSLAVNDDDGDESIMPIAPKLDKQETTKKISSSTTRKPKSSISNIIVHNDKTEISPQEYINCDKISSVTLPDTVTSIGDEAFKGCVNLKNINIPLNVTTIGKEAFSDCKALTAIKLPRGIEILNASLFSCCHNLAEVNIPKTVTEISEYVFFNCRSLQTIILPKSVKKISNSAFAGCCGLTEISLADGLEYIGDCAFSGCHKLLSVTIPDTVVYFGKGVFAYCNSLVSVKFGKHIETIDKNMFAHLGNCTSLKRVYIPSSVKTIEEGTFVGFKGLKIYCESKRKPEGWQKGWKSLFTKAVWGYKGN